MTERKWQTEEEKLAEDVERNRQWLLEHGQHHIGEKRVMRRGTVVECVDVFGAYHFGKTRPYVRLRILTGLLKGTVIERSFSTMMSYPLKESIEEE